MRKIIVISLLLIVGVSLFGQPNDSTIVNKMNDNYIEIQSLRHALWKWTVIERGAIKESFIPQPIPLKNGIVFIKDRLNRPIAFYVYSDSIIINEEHFSESKLSWQSIILSDSTGIEKKYWKNGKLQSLAYWGNNQKMIYNYTKEGALIEVVEDYTELIRNADTYFSNKEFQKAHDYYKKALDIKPNETYPKNKLLELEVITKKISTNKSTSSK